MIGTRRRWGGGINPEVATALVGLLQTGLQAGAGLAAQRRQAEAMQRQAELAAQAQANAALAMMQPSASKIGVAAVLGGVLLLGLFGTFVVLATRRRR